MLTVMTTYIKNSPICIYGYYATKNKQNKDAQTNTWTKSYCVLYSVKKKYDQLVRKVHEIYYFGAFSNNFIIKQTLAIIHLLAPDKQGQSDHSQASNCSHLTPNL